VITLLQLYVGVLLDWRLGEPHRFHPLVGFGRLAECIDRQFPEAYPLRNRFTGLIAVGLPVGVIVGLVWMLDQILVFGTIAGVVLFYGCLGAKSLLEHAERVIDALMKADLPTAQQAVGRMVSRDVRALDEVGVARACVESVLENGNDAIFGTIFWFAVAGAPGAVAHRLINTLDSMWGYRTDRYQQFGWAAARLDDLLNWIPARLCAATYALLGDTKTALACWKRQAPAWESPNAGPVMAAGAGALQVRLGGPDVYHGEIRSRPVLGTGHEPSVEAIQRALWLVQYGMLFWLLIIALIVVGRFLSHA